MENLLINIIGQNFALGLIMPPLFAYLTKHIQDKTAKERIVWAVCLALSIIIGAMQGMFDPVISTFQNAPRNEGRWLMVTYATIKVLAASFTTLLITTTVAYNRFWKPNAEAKAQAVAAREERSAIIAAGGLPEDEVTVGRTVKSALVGAVTAKINPRPAPEPLVGAAPNSLQEIEGPDVEVDVSNYDPTEGTPERAVEEITHG